MDATRISVAATCRDGAEGGTAPLEFPMRVIDALFRAGKSGNFENI